MNLLQEKMATSTDASQMEAQLQLLVVDNERQAREAEDLYDLVKTAKEKVAITEREIQRVSRLRRW